MSHPEIINACKKITIVNLIDAFGQVNIVSIILYGSVARNEESYKYVNGKPYLESDLDVLVVVKSKTIVVKSLIILRRLCRKITGELREKWSLSHINLSFTTENRLLLTRPNFYHLGLKLNGKVIFGKELIGLMPSYGYDRYKEIPIFNLTTNIFGHMISIVSNIASSGIFDGNTTTEGYNSILKSIRKLTLFLLRVIIIKRALPVNPYDLTEIKSKRNLLQTKISICDDLLNSYEDIKLCDSRVECSMVELEKYLVRVITQFNLTITVLTGITYPFVTLPEKLLFGQVPLISRLEYCAYVFLMNLDATFTMDLIKFMILIIGGAESINLRYYNLFVSSSNLIKTTNDENENADTFQKRQSWLKLYRKSLKPWKYDITRE
jgi:predicted nucleotidyltransferase